MLNRTTRRVRRSLKPGLKTVCRKADNPTVQCWTFIAAFLLAVSGAVPSGARSGVSSAFDDMSASKAYDIPGAGNYDGTAPMPATGLSVSAPHRPGAPAHNGYTIRRNVPEVQLQFTVADEHGRPVPDIAESDIRIFDDQVPVDHIAQFEKVSDLPLSIGLLLDVSDSMKPVLEQARSVALTFLKRVVRPGTDRAFVIAFGDSIQIFQNSTGQVADLLGAVERAKGPGEATDFYDAIYSGCTDHWTAIEIGPVRRVMVLISDGEDTGSLHGLNDVIAAAQRNEIQIYALNIRSRKRNYTSDGVLQLLADETGGRFFMANNTRDAEAFLGQLEAELRTQYYVSFHPPDEIPGYHALQIEVRAPRKLMVHARHGYYAVN